MPAELGQLTSEITGEIEKTEDGVLVIRRIHAVYRLVVDRLDDRLRGKIRRSMRLHRERCLVARTLRGCVEITTVMEVRVGDDPGVTWTVSDGAEEESE